MNPQASRVVAFGEALLRLTPPDGLPLSEANSVSVHVGGCEANVAAGLATLGVPATWFSLLPQGALGNRVAGQLTALGVDTSFVQRAPGRLGVYYMEEGNGPRPASVIYDRADSSITLISDQVVDTALAAGLLQGACALVTSGITLALGPAVHAAAIRLWGAAGRQPGLLRVFDINYRSKLASPNQAVQLAAPLLADTQVLIGAARDVSLLYGGLDELRAVAPKACIVITDGAQGAKAYLPDGSLVAQPSLPVGTVGRIGRGDAFAAGLLASLIGNQSEISQQSVGKALAWGVASASFKSTWPGDLPVLNPEGVRALLDQGGGADVLR